MDSLIYNHSAAPESFIGHPNYEFININLLNLDKLTDVYEGINHVVILAGLVGDPITKKYPVESECINESGIQNILELLNNQGIQKVVFKAVSQIFFWKNTVLHVVIKGC